MSSVVSNAEFRRLMGEAQVKKLAEDLGFDVRSLTGKNRRALREALLRRYPTRTSKSKGPSVPK